MPVFEKARLINVCGIFLASMQRNSAQGIRTSHYNIMARE